MLQPPQEPKKHPKGALASMVEGWKAMFSNIAPVPFNRHITVFAADALNEHIGDAIENDHTWAEHFDSLGLAR